VDELRTSSEAVNMLADGKGGALRRQIAVDAGLRSDAALPRRLRGVTWNTADNSTTVWVLRVAFKPRTGLVHCRVESWCVACVPRERAPRCTAMKKLRIVMLRFGTGRQKMVLGTMDTSQTFAPCVYMRVRATIVKTDFGGVAKRPRCDPPLEIPNVTIRDFLIAVRWSTGSASKTRKA
jgi:hypothetical protein